MGGDSLVIRLSRWHFFFVLTERLNLIDRMTCEFTNVITAIIYPHFWSPVVSSLLYSFSSLPRLLILRWQSDMWIWGIKGLKFASLWLFQPHRFELRIIQVRCHWIVLNFISFSFMLEDKIKRMFRYNLNKTIVLII